MAARVVRFRVNGRPVGQPRHRVGAPRRGSGGKGNRSYVPEDHPVHAWKAQVTLAARAAYGPRPPVVGPLAVDVLFVMPRPKYLGVGGRAWFPRTPDRDNLDKALLDACKNILWADDAQVVDGHVAKVYAASGEEAHADVTVSYAGVVPAEPDCDE